MWEHLLNKANYRLPSLEGKVEPKNYQKRKKKDRLQVWTWESTSLVKGVRLGY